MMKGCKICNHPDRLHIEKLKFVDEYSLREIESEMKQRNPGESFCISTLARHFKHVDSKREIQVKYITSKSKDEIEADLNMSEVDMQVNEVKRLDVSIQESSLMLKASAKELRRQLNIRVPKYVTEYGPDGKPKKKKFKYEKVDVSHSVVQLFKIASEEIRQTTKTKNEILGIDSKSKGVEAAGTLVDLLLGIDSE